MTLKFDGWPRKFLGHIFYTTSRFVHHIQILRWIQTEVTVRKHSVRVKLVIFLSHVTLIFYGWPCKTIGHLFYNSSSFVHNSKTMDEFKLELQSGNTQFGSKLAIFCPMWPWNSTDDLEQGKSDVFESCDRPIVRKRPIWVKIGDVLPRVTLQFDVWPWKTIGHLFYVASSFVHHFITIGEFKLELQSRNGQFGSKLTIFIAVWPWNLTYDLEKQ